jgi:hypothetical protein
MTHSPIAPLARFLYTSNPFYLIGTLVILLGLQQCLAAEPRLGTSGLLTGLLAGYALLLAAIAVLVIRVGRIWDDARTILLVIVLLFFMLSASLDVQLVDSPRIGTLALAAALAFAIGLSETLLRVLRIHLAATYRGPYYLILTTLFLYPALPAWLPHVGRQDQVGWAILAFPLLMGLALLTLLPAARTRRRREPASNTPWLWPYYPWSLFVFLSIGAALRAWWLTISFEPQPGSQSYFRPYFLLPICLAWSALILEMGKSHRSWDAVAAGMLLPLLGLAGSFPGTAHSVAESVYLDRVVSTIGSPSQLAVGGLLLFYGWAWLQRIRAAEGFLIGLGLLSSVVGPETVSMNSFCPPRPLPLAVVATALLLRGVQTRSSWRAIAGLAMLVVGVRYSGVIAIDDRALRFWQWHAPLLALMVLSTLFHDSLARKLRELSWRGAPCLALAAVTFYPWLLSEATPPVLASYLGLLTVVSLLLWQRQPDVGPLTASLVTAAADGLLVLQLGYGFLEGSWLDKSLPWLAAGSGTILLGLLISLHKMGVFPRAAEWLQRLNLTLLPWASPASPAKG